MPDPPDAEGERRRVRYDDMDFVTSIAGDEPRLRRASDQDEGGQWGYEAAWGVARQSKVSPGVQRGLPSRQTGLGCLACARGIATPPSVQSVVRTTAIRRPTFIASLSIP
jgi:hypothetical protein